MPITQGLLSRNPSLTPEEFSASWYKDHAALVVPYFLSHGITYYAQVHSPLTTIHPTLSNRLATGAFDGAAEMKSEEVTKVFASGIPEPKWKKDYYQQVILKDEERLLKSQALEHILQVEPDTVMGVRRVVIEGGECKIEVPEGVWKVWREFEGRGQEEEEEGEGGK